MTTDMETWVHDNSDRIFGFLVYKKLFTPYEQEEKFIDESQFEDDHYTCARIHEAIDLGHGEWLIGFQIVDDDQDEDADVQIEYHRTSDIRLFSFDWMQRKFNDNTKGDEDTW